MWGNKGGGWVEEIYLVKRTAKCQISGPIGLVGVFKVSKVNKSYISYKKITKFSAQKFLQGKNKDTTVVPTSRSYWVSWNFFRSSAVLNLFTGWGVPEP